MEAPVNIVVESPDGKKAALVGRAIAQSLKDNYGFEQVMSAHLVEDSEFFRSWQVPSGEESEESLLSAMVALNPGIMQTPVTIVSREQPDTTQVEMGSVPSLGQDKRPDVLTIGGIGEVATSLEELREQAWKQYEPQAKENLVREIENFFDREGLTITKISSF
jgi:hypothetical protein